MGLGRLAEVFGTRPISVLATDNTNPVPVLLFDGHGPFLARGRRDHRLGPKTHELLGHSPTGDGILTALLVLRALRRLGTDLGALVAPVRVWPQVRADVPVADRERVLADPTVQAAIQGAEVMLYGTGRLVVRASGTQPLIRIMAEGPDEPALRRAVEGIVEAVARVGARA